FSAESSTVEKLRDASDADISRIELRLSESWSQIHFIKVRLAYTAPEGRRWRVDNDRAALPVDGVGKEPPRNPAPGVHDQQHPAPVVHGQRRPAASAPPSPRHHRGTGPVDLQAGTTATGGGSSTHRRQGDRNDPA